MKVQFPHGGSWHLLQWNTRNEGNHLVLSPSEKGILTVVKNVIDKISIPDIMGYWKIKIGAPPQEILEAEKIIKLNVDRLDFWRHLSFLGGELKKKQGLPYPLIECQKFEQTYEDCDPDAWSKERHIDCKNCILGIAVDLSNEDKETFFLERRDLFKQEVLKNRGGNQGYESRAELPSNNQPLMFVGAEFGSHSSGTVLQQFEMPKDNLSEIHWWPPGFRNVLFFYTLEEELSQDNVMKLITDAKEEAKISVRKEKNQYKKHQEDHINKQWKELMTLLNNKKEG